MQLPLPPELEFEASSSVRHMAHVIPPQTGLPGAAAEGLTPCWALSLRPWSPAAHSPCCHSLRSLQGIPSCEGGGHCEGSRGGAVMAEGRAL